MQCMHFIGRVTLFFANNSLTKFRSPKNFYTIFLDHEVIFSSHTAPFNPSTKDFTHMHLVT